MTGRKYRRIPCGPSDVCLPEKRYFVVTDQPPMTADECADALRDWGWGMSFDLEFAAAGPIGRGLMFTTITNFKRIIVA